MATKYIGMAAPGMPEAPQPEIKRTELEEYTRPVAREALGARELPPAEGFKEHLARGFGAFIPQLAELGIASAVGGPILGGVGETVAKGIGAIPKVASWVAAHPRLGEAIAPMVRDAMLFGGLGAAHGGEEAAREAGAGAIAGMAFGSLHPFGRIARAIGGGGIGAMQTYLGSPEAKPEEVAASGLLMGVFGLLGGKGGREKVVEELKRGGMGEADAARATEEFERLRARSYGINQEAALPQHIQDLHTEWQRLEMERLAGEAGKPGVNFGEIQRRQGELEKEIYVRNAEEWYRGKPEWKGGMEGGEEAGRVGEGAKPPQEEEINPPVVGMGAEEVAPPETPKTGVVEGVATETPTTETTPTETPPTEVNPKEIVVGYDDQGNPILNTTKSQDTVSQIRGDILAKLRDKVINPDFVDTEIRKMIDAGKTVEDVSARWTEKNSSKEASRYAKLYAEDYLAGKGAGEGIGKGGTEYGQQKVEGEKAEAVAEETGTAGEAGEGGAAGGGEERKKIAPVIADEATMKDRLKKADFWPDTINSMTKEDLAGTYDWLMRGADPYETKESRAARGKAIVEGKEMPEPVVPDSIAEARRKAKEGEAVTPAPPNVLSMGKYKTAKEIQDRIAAINSKLGDPATRKAAISKLEAERDKLTKALRKGRMQVIGTEGTKTTEGGIELPKMPEDAFEGIEFTSQEYKDALKAWEDKVAREKEAEAEKRETERLARLEKGAEETKPKFSVEEPTGSSTIVWTLDRIKSSFPGQEVIPTDTGEFLIRTQTGHTIRVNPNDRTIYNNRQMAEQLGRTPLPGERVAGSWQKLDEGGIIGLTEASSEATLPHEAFHAAMDLAANPGERKVVYATHGGSEQGADAYSRWKLNRESVTPVGKVFQKVWDWAWRLRDGLFGPSAEGVFRAIESGRVWKKGPTWYSQMGDVVREKLPGMAGVNDVRGMLKKWADKGEFKREEYEWSGVDEWLRERSGKVTKAEVEEFLRGNQIEVKEVWKGFGPEEKRRLDELDNIVRNEGTLTPEEQAEYNRLTEQESFPKSSGTKYGPDVSPNLSIPGGENYREVLLTLPSKTDYSGILTIEQAAPYLPKDHKFTVDWDGAYLVRDPEGTVVARGNTPGNALEKLNSHPWLFTGTQGVYRSSHWPDTPNVLAHVRMNDRVDSAGRRVLFLEEVQSDWHQTGRKYGYGTREDIDAGKAMTGAVPNAPFKTTWPLLAIKRMVRYAAENGYDGIAWTTGEMQAERYDLSKYINHINYQGADVREDGRIRVMAVGKDGQQVFDQAVEPSELPNIVGKEVADRILAGEGTVRRDRLWPTQVGNYKQLAGLDLKVGGEGMKAFYDRMLPNEVNKYVKKWGSRVEETEIQTEGQSWTSEEGPQPAVAESVPFLPITDSMRQSVIEKGQPLFSISNISDPTSAVRASTTSTRESLDRALDTLTPGWNILKSIKTGAQSLISPGAKSPETLKAAETLGGKLGTMSRLDESSASLLKPANNYFTRNPDQANGFMSAMSTGAAIPTHLQGYANTIKQLFARGLQALERAGVPLETVRQNYFPGMWTRESRRAFNQAVEEAISGGIGMEGSDLNSWTPDQKSWVRNRTEQLLSQRQGSDSDIGLQYLSRRPFEGSEAFRKPKVFDDIQTALDFGLKPVSKHPIDLVKLKLGEIHRSAMANEAIRDWKESGDIIAVGRDGLPMNPNTRQAIPNAERPAPGEWVKINDKYGTIWYRDQSGQLVKAGEYLARRPVADVLNNYLSSSLYNNEYFGGLYRSYMKVANLLNQAQLGIGSFFHAGFSTSETVFSGLALNLKDFIDMTHGKISPKEFSQGLYRTLTASVENPIYGGRILNEWLNPGSSQDRGVQALAKAVEMAGGRSQLEVNLQTNVLESMKRDWFSDSKIKAAAKSPFAMIELMARPVMVHLVPRQKLAVFGHLVERLVKEKTGMDIQELASDPMALDRTLNTLQPDLRQEWNRTDARLGQVVYDRVFMNNAAKSVIQMLIRAPGWSGGTIAEVGGGFKDAAKILTDWAKTGKPPEQITDRMAYTASLLAGAAIANGVMTYALTGEQPEGMDWWAFRTGNKDEYGRNERMMFPTYAKDIMAYYQHPTTTLLHKTHPLLSVISEAARNKDYYGTEVRSPGEDLFTQLGELGWFGIKQFVPFWMRGVGKEAERSGYEVSPTGIMDTFLSSPLKVLAPQIGIMPAPAEFGKTQAERLMTEIGAEERASGAATKAEREHFDLKRRIRHDYMAGDIGSAEARIQGAIDQGSLSRREISDLRKTAKETPSSYAFKRLKADDALRVWNLMTQDERRAASGEMLTKMKSVIKNASPEKRNELLPMFREALAQ